MKDHMLHIIWTALLVLTISIVEAQQSEVHKPLGEIAHQGLGYNPVLDRKLLDVNRISAWFRNDGEFYADHGTFGAGFEWPKGQGIHAVFSGGLWLGARVDGLTRVATVGHFGSEFRPGRIFSPGVWEDPSGPHLRVYRVRPLIDGPGDPDFAGWPVDQGAPWIDIDADGIWNPNVDKPGLRWPQGPEFPDMMLFYVTNDANPAHHTHRWGGSAPLGAEVRTTAWASEGALQDVQWLRFQIFNKSNTTWDSLYLILWSDPDLGGYTDDYVGCDTTLDVHGRSHALGYCYNGNAIDPQYGSAPPAFGFRLIQGPAIATGNMADTATAFGRLWPGYRNLVLSGFNMYCNPGVGGCMQDYYDPLGFEQTYNVMRGLTPLGAQWINPVTSQPTTFVFSGDPVSGTGWLNSHQMPPSDVRMTMSTGPINLAPGDSLDIVYGALIARGTSSINSITELRALSAMVGAVYRNQHVLAVGGGGTLPETFVLHDNFPNPFNPGTVIRFDLPQSEHVILEIINLLGQRVRVLVDEARQAGRHETVWDGTSDGGRRVASGVYFYRLTAGHERAMKKMVLLQ